jgi:hypothetical protein
MQSLTNRWNWNRLWVTRDSQCRQVLPIDWQITWSWSTGQAVKYEKANEEE